jgi:hypothetical protein
MCASHSNQFLTVATDTRLTFGRVHTPYGQLTLQTSLRKNGQCGKRYWVSLLRRDWRLFCEGKQGGERTWLMRWYFASIMRMPLRRYIVHPSLRPQVAHSDIGFSRSWTQSLPRCWWTPRPFPAKSRASISSATFCITLLSVYTKHGSFDKNFRRDFRSSLTTLGPSIIHFLAG